MHKFNHDFSCILAIFAVSLFTREWIEMGKRFRMIVWIRCVSLFTREWIEMMPRQMRPVSAQASPSLRGSGLKYPSPLLPRGWRSLPLYEGVD